MPLGTSSSHMVTVAMLDPILPPVGVAMAFVPHSVGDAGVPAENSLLLPAVLGGSPSVEGTLAPYRLPDGPLEWSSCDEGGDAFRAERLSGGQGLAARGSAGSQGLGSVCFR